MPPVAGRRRTLVGRKGGEVDGMEGGIGGKTATEVGERKAAG